MADHLPLDSSGYGNCHWWADYGL